MFCFLILLLQYSCAQDQKINYKQKTPVEVSSVKKFHSDLGHLASILTGYHPKPFEFITKENFELLVQKERDKISNATTIEEFYWSCRKVTAAIGCVHTRINNPSLTITDSIKFPLKVNYLDSKLFVVDPLSNSGSVNKGNEILTINNVAVSEIRDKIFLHLSADGYNESYKQYYLNQYFPIYCAYQLNFPEAYTIVTSENISIELKSSLHINSSDSKLDCQDKLCYQSLDNTTSLMTIKGFGFYGDEYSIFKKFIDESFEKVNSERIQNLIIDLRGNSGGEAYCASYLLQHLLSEEFIYFTPNTSGYNPLKEVLEPDPDLYNGNIYVLIDGNCVSSTGHFLAILKYFKRGILIGSESGATYTCNDNSKALELPNTKFSLRVAQNVYEVFVKGLSNKEGVKPDIEVSPTIDDILNFKDSTLAHTIKIITKE